MPIQLDFIAAALGGDGGGRRGAALAAALQGRLRARPRAGSAPRITKHYEGDDSDLKLLMAGVAEAFGGMTVDDYAASAADVLRRGASIRRSTARTASCAFLPMVELLRYLEANGFATYIASGGDRDFMRSIARRRLRHPARARDRLELRPRVRRRRQLAYKKGIDFFDDGPEKPVRIWSRIGRRPALGGGNSNGDIPMLRLLDRPAAARRARRRRARVRLHGRRRGRAGAAASRRSASRTTGRPCSRDRVLRPGCGRTSALAAP